MLTYRQLIKSGALAHTFETPRLEQDDWLITKQNVRHSFTNWKGSEVTTNFRAFERPALRGHSDRSVLRVKTSSS